MSALRIFLNNVKKFRYIVREISGLQRSSSIYNLDQW